MSFENPRVYIILVNRNGWSDTVECLESLFRLDYPDFRVIVCDNASTDDSLERISSWAEGHLSVLPAGSALDRLTRPPTDKPISVVRYSGRIAELGGNVAEDPALTLISNNANLGFAGGCNVGIRFALTRRDAAFIWLLNNDTVSEPHALTAMVRRMRNSPPAGMCGSRVLYYYQPETVQVLGGASFNRNTGATSLLAHKTKRSAVVDTQQLEGSLDCIYGASMLITREYLQDIGLMDESYFLYYEEVDWALRGRLLFTLVYADDSIIYHKEGASIGSGSRVRKQTILASYYSARNRLLILSKHHPAALPWAYCAVVKSAFGRLLRGQPNNAWVMLRVLIGGGRDLTSILRRQRQSTVSSHLLER